MARIGHRAKQTRSGRQVAGTAFAAGSVTSLLAPWVNQWVSGVSTSTGVMLDMAYADQVLGLTVACVTWVASQAKMLWIEYRDRQAGDDGSDQSEVLAEALMSAEAELKRLRQERGV